MAAHTKDTVRLPSSGVEFCNYVSLFGNTENFASTRAEEFPASLRAVIKYSGSALKIGRPYHKVMIVMCGESGVGKSSTIKALFNDEACLSGIEESETRQVTEYAKKLCVTAEEPNVEGLLCFIDLPGNFHPDSLTQVQNLAAITQFQQQHSDLQVRSPLPVIEEQHSLTVRKQVYPNTVLFTVKATDNRMVGPDSTLRKSLRALKETNLVDTENSNLIVVVTHAMSIPSKIYKTKSEDIARIIRLAVYDILQIVDSKVVFVENRPEDFNMAKPLGNDFFQLPDGQLSHYNLLQAMVDQYDASKDFLGKLLCGWYFTDDKCTEKRNKTTILYKIESDKLSNEEMTKSQDFFTSLTSQNSENLNDSIPTFQFQNLGRGYCPRTETLRNVVVFRPKETKILDIHGKSYVFPDRVNVTLMEEDTSYLMTKLTKEKYEAQKISSYGLSADNVNLDVHIDSAGRWVKNNTGYNNSEVVFVYEKHLIHASLQEPQTTVKEELLDTLMQLPNSYNDQTCHLFNEFFSKWGSHFIDEEMIGGCIEVEVNVMGSTYSEAEGLEIHRSLKSHFETCKRSGNSEQTVKVQINSFMITALGGEISGFHTLADVTPIRFVNWLNSLKPNPVELQNTFKLYPYYSLVEGPQHVSLKAATFDYLTAEYMQKLQARRPKFGVKRNESGYRIVERARETSFDFSCFPPFTKVYTKQGLTSVSSLKGEDVVLTVNISKKSNQAEVQTTSFCSYLHYDPDIVAEFVVLHLENGCSLTVTGNHLVYHCNKDGYQAVRAKNIKVGDMLLYITEGLRPKLVKVSGESVTYIQGVYSPLTNSGTLIADGIFVSCYANVDSHIIAHASTAPLRMWHKLLNGLISVYSNSFLMKWSFLTSNEEEYKSQSNFGIHGYAKVLMLMSRWLPFEIIKG